MYKKSSLYRVYRPSNFNEVAGHNFVKKILIKQIKNENFSHALLFSGQRGTGKTSVAKIFAKVINCENISNDGVSCEKCESCIESNNNSHPDIFEIDAASNNGVDEIRNIKNNVVTLPILSKYKVYIIDEVHMLTTSAFNALLKTLEEPPKHVVFILATTEINKIPLTIISRCQTFNFAKIAKCDLINKIKEISKKESIEIDNDSLNEIYYLSDGSLRDAINILEQAASFSNNKIQAESFKEIFSIATKKEKLSILINVLNNNPEYLINFFEDAEKQGLNFQNITISLIDIVKEIIEARMSNNKKNSTLLSVQDISEFDVFSDDKLFEIADYLVEAFEKSRNSSISNKYLLINMLKLSKNSRIIGQNDKKNVENNENKISEKQEQKLVEINDQKTVIDVEKTTEIINENEIEIKEETVETIENKTTLIFEEVEEKSDQKADIENISLIDFGIEKMKFIEEIAYELNKEIIFSNEILFAATKGSLKEKRLQIEKKFNDVFDKENPDFNINRARDFVIFHGAKYISANDNAVMILEEDSLSASAFNHALQDEKFRRKIFSFLDEEIAFIVLDKKRLDMFKEEYRLNKKNLNEYKYEIDLDTFYYEILSEEEKENTIIEEAQSLFLDKDFKVID